MVFAFDTLSYARFLRDRGVSQEHAEAHAEAARQFIMAELVTKTDLQAVAGQFGARLDNLSLHVDTKLENFSTHFDTKLESFSTHFDTKLESFSTHFDTKLANLSTQFDTKLDNLSLRLTVRLGIMLGAGVGALAALVKLT
jgi:hypothetical protein